MGVGYVFRVRLASFFAGAACASAFGLYVLHGDYQASHHILSQQAKELYSSLDGRISELEKLKQNVASSDQQHPTEQHHQKNFPEKLSPQQVAACPPDRSCREHGLGQSRQNTIGFLVPSMASISPKISSLSEKLLDLGMRNFPVWSLNTSIRLLVLKRKRSPTQWAQALSNRPIWPVRSLLSLRRLLS
eukprot:Gb_31488 [translate_table: standard]